MKTLQGNSGEMHPNQRAMKHVGYYSCQLLWIVWRQKATRDETVDICLWNGYDDSSAKAYESLSHIPLKMVIRHRNGSWVLHFTVALHRGHDCSGKFLRWPGLNNGQFIRHEFVRVMGRDSKLIICDWSCCDKEKQVFCFWCISVEKGLIQFITILFLTVIVSKARYIKILIYQWSVIWRLCFVALVSGHNIPGGVASSSSFQLVLLGGRIIVTLCVYFPPDFNLPLLFTRGERGSVGSACWLMTKGLVV